MPYPLPATRPKPPRQPIVYTLLDLFHTARAAGAIDATAAETGPGTRAVVDTDPLMTIRSSMLHISPESTPASGDPGVWYGAFSRSNTPLLLMQLAHQYPVANRYYFAGWGTASGAIPQANAFYGRGLSKLNIREVNASRLVIDYCCPGMFLNLAILLRSGGGAVYFALGSTLWPAWTILCITPTDANATLYPAIAGNTAYLAAKHIAVPDQTWFPTPLATDGFSDTAPYTTDGLGISEGGGASVAWVDTLGTWQNAAGVASASALDGGLAIRTLTAHANVLASIKLPTIAGGLSGIIVRYVDTDNYIYAWHNGATNQAGLVKRIAGAETDVIAATAATYGATNELQLICDGTAFWLRYGVNQVSTKKAITDAALQSATGVGLLASNTGNTFDAFYVMPRTSDAIHARLTRYMHRFTDYVSVYKEDADNYYVYMPLPNDPDALAEWRLRITPGTNVFCIRTLKIIRGYGASNRITLGDASTAWEYAYNIGITDDDVGDFGWFGCLHVNETRTALTFLMDGTQDITALANGASLFGRSLILQQTIDTLLPKDGVTVCGETVLTHTFDEGYLVVQHTHTYQSGYQIYNCLSAMASTTMAGSSGIDTYKIGDNDAAARAQDDGTKNINTETATVLGYHSSAHNYQLRMYLPSGGPDHEGDWSKSGAYKFWFLDGSAESNGKYYLNWISALFAERVTAEASAHTTHYIVEKR